jgi:cell division protein FtsZ
VKTIMAGMGYAVMGTATAKGDGRATRAAQAAIASPLLEAGAIDGARGILINVTGSSSLRLAEVNEASTIIQSAAHEDANIIFGAVLDEKMKDDVKITVIATGFKEVHRHHDHANPGVDAVHNVRGAAASVHATYQVPSISQPGSSVPSAESFVERGRTPSQSSSVIPSDEVVPQSGTAEESRDPYSGRERERPAVSYVPDGLDDISEVVRHAAPKEEEAVPIDTVTSSPDITYNADDLEVPAFMRKRGQS